MIEHDKGCRGCARRTERWNMPVWANIAHCSRYGYSSSGSYSHFVDGVQYCDECADIMARAKNEVAIGIGW